MRARLGRSSFISFVYGAGRFHRSIRNLQQSLFYHFFSEWFATILTLFISISGWISVFVLASMKWPGKTNQYDCFQNYLLESECFCEYPRQNVLIAQPANTYSNIFFNMVGLVASWSVDTKKFPNARWWNTHVNSLTYSNWFAYSFGPIVANIGVSSAMMHAGKFNQVIFFARYR